MVLFDSNIFIYVASGKLKLAEIDGIDACYASVSTIEVLGYINITAAEERKLAQIFESYQLVDLSESIIQRAVELRQLKKMSLGDAIVAATAIDQDCQLWTVNDDDFANIPNLKVYNPFRKKELK